MIRKQNSEFSTSFVSEAVGSIKNTDCFAHVELDGLACYVLADGIDEKYGAEAARLCVDSVISSFTESPSMSKRSLRKYSQIANDTLKKQKRRSRLKASIIIVVHNYAKLRYVMAGNVRFRLYRDGFLKYGSKDQSLGMELVLSEKIAKDKLAIHEERHNLQCYIGLEHNFMPFVSKKMKLLNADSIALFTRGFWESIDDGELLDLFKDAGTDPKETVDTAEDMLLTKHSAKTSEHAIQSKKKKKTNTLESYSFVAIFVNKTFVNPNIKRNIKKVLKIAIPIILIVLVISLLLYFRYKNKEEKITLMKDNYFQTIEYILADNYIKAETKANDAISLAIEVKDQKMKEDATNYLMLVESIIVAEEYLSKGNYEDAQEGFLNALDRSKYADNMSDTYLKNKLKLTADYISVYDLIALGDAQVLNLQYDEAEEKYLTAKILASTIHFDTGRQNAMTALEELYALEKELAEKLQNDTNSVVELEISAANFVVLADTAFTAKEYEEALVYYTSALQKYDQLGDAINSEVMQKKIDTTHTNLADIESKRDEAADYVRLAEDSYANQNYVDAKKYYLLAKDVYAGLKDESKIDSMTTKIAIIDLEQAGRLAELAVAEESEVADEELAESEESDVADESNVMDEEVETDAEKPAESEMVAVDEVFSESKEIVEDEVVEVDNQVATEVVVAEVVEANEILEEDERVVEEDFGEE